MRRIFSVLLLTLPLSPAASADDAQDKQVELGVKAYDDGDYQRAKDILLPLAEAGIAQAMHIIGRMHDGTDVFPNDPKLECDWYQRAADKGLAKSMYNLSLCYDYIGGREKNRERELYWRTKAAEHGLIQAMVNLAAEDKTHGEEYRLWMNRAVEHGSKYAMLRLWQVGYEDDVPNIRIRDITCTYIRILIFDEDITACDGLR
ncbi:tetratricopeptide repeat protein [Magnetovibrio sp.]|uniref:tetratricopeptide repeat protein n=1 Tax=Magnetovibrio sp. TaxID=2024836 RepID=UPI002F95B0AB